MASEASGGATTLQDVAALARKLADREPYKSASGPEALLALATHLDGLMASKDGGRRNIVQVEVRKKGTEQASLSPFDARCSRCPTGYPPFVLLTDQAGQPRVVWRTGVPCGSYESFRLLRDGFDGDIIL